MKNRNGNRKSKFNFEKEDLLIFWRSLIGFIVGIIGIMIGIKDNSVLFLIISPLALVCSGLLLFFILLVSYKPLSKAEKIKIKYEKQQYRERLLHKLDYMSVYKEVISELKSKGRFISCNLALNPTYEKWMEETDFNKLINKLRNDGFEVWSYKKGDYHCFEARLKED